MRIGPLLACIAPIVLVASLVIPASADTPPPTLYVGVPGVTNCSDTGQGTYAEPFCTVQEAADVVVPGQTVVVGSDTVGTNVSGDVHLTRSGTPDQPITFTTGLSKNPMGNGPAYTIDGGPNAFTLNGVHDIKIDGFGVADTSGAGIVVSNSSDITINDVAIGVDIPQLPATDGIDISGTSSNVTVSRSSLQTKGTEVAIGPGVTGTDVAENYLSAGAGAMAVSVNGAAGTDIVNNTAFATCSVPGFSVAGGATGTSIENNLLTAGCTTSAALLTVAADSAASTRSDYNIVSDENEPGLYSWAGTSYDSPAALTAATGQGAHDRDEIQPLTPGLAPMEGTPAVDSADADAPGLLATDYNGNPRVDDPSDANTGTGIGYVDRGAVELQDPMTLSLSTNTTKAPTGGTVVATLSAVQGWAPITGYTVDFGDGTPLATSTSPTITHVYSSVGAVPYRVTATVTDSLGNATTAIPSFPYGITVVPPAPLVPILSARSFQSSPLDAYAYIYGSTDSWSLESATCDFGDGTGVQQSVSLGCNHTYAAYGTYWVTMTVTDADGNTATATAEVIAQPVPASPTPTPGSGRHCASCR